MKYGRILIMKKILRFEITDKCNQKCNMCWSTDWKHNDLKWENIEKIVYDYNEMYPAGTIVLTSREPLLSSSFENFLELTKKLNITVKLLTNGTLFTDRICKLIVNSTIDFISISIHGSEDIHNEIVGSLNSYNLIINGLYKINDYKKKYNRSNLNIRITTVINEHSLDSIEEIINICKKTSSSLRMQHLMWHSTKIKSKHKKKIKKKFGYNDNIIDGFLSNTGINYDYVIKTIKKAKEICSKENVELQIYPDLDESDILEWYSSETSNNQHDMYCDHVSESIRMRANGDISLCQYIDKYYGNAVKQNLNDILLSKAYNNIANDLNSGLLFPICYHCCHLRKKKKDIKSNNSKI